MISSVGFEAIQSAVMIERSEGKAHFASEDFPEAEERYKVALRLLETTPDEVTGVKEELLTVLRLNRDELDGPIVVTLRTRTIVFFDSFSSPHFNWKSQQRCEISELYA